MKVITPVRKQLKKVEDLKGKFYLETYGCQMNVADSELVVSILNKDGYQQTFDYKEAEIVLINTCAIRDNAEQRIRNRLHVFTHEKKHKNIKVGILGCMAERLKEKLLDEEKSVDFVVGPDAYRRLPQLLLKVKSGMKSVDVALSKSETYDDLLPSRLDDNGVSAFVSIMRGCDNMCAFCVVPFTRGRERSRDPESIMTEIKQAIGDGYKEITVIGQNVDKYNWENGKMNFAQLLENIALLDNGIRIRFSTSYPQDMTDEVLHTIAKYSNICKYIHLPVQSGSTRMLGLMKRGYTREWYMDRITAIRAIIPDCAISTDMITGFSSETDADHQETVSLMKWAKFDYSYMFKYSERPNTFAHRNLPDDVPDETKGARLQEIIEIQSQLSLESNQQDVGKVFEILIEGVSKRSADRLYGRNSQNKVIIFDRHDAAVGDYVHVKVLNCTSATLRGELVDLQ